MSPGKLALLLYASKCTRTDVGFRRGAVEGKDLIVLSCSLAFVPVDASRSFGTLCISFAARVAVSLCVGLGSSTF